MSVTGPMKYLTIGDSTYEVYNTDTKVTQTYATASGYTYWRPLVVGYSSGSTETSTPATTTNTTYVFDTIKVKPSNGTIRFGAAALYNGDYTTTISTDTLTAARTVTVPDKSGVMALTSDIPSIPTTISSFTNDAGYLTSYTESDPIFTASAAAGITSTDISNWNGKVSDDHKWNDVSLIKGDSSNNGTIYIPFLSSSTGTTANITSAVSSPGASRIAKYDSTAYLHSTTPSANDNSTKVATTAYVDSVITALPEPMIFKGSLGTGGTITSLPAASSSNEGFTYKVITAGTYASQEAEVGDTFISDGSSWVLIPSGDEPSGTVTSVGLSNATNGGLTISGSPITSSGSITVGHSNVLTSAQTTQAVYPIKIDKNGHISAYGTAVTIPDVSGKFDTAGVGLDSSGTTVKTKINSETSLGTIGTTDKLYAIGVDSNGKLAVKVPWSNDMVYMINDDTTIYLAGSYSSNSITHYLYKNSSLYATASSDAGTIYLTLGDSATSGKEGYIRLYGSSTSYTDLKVSASTSAKTITFPDKTGTVALTSDIPTASGALSKSTNDIQLNFNDGTQNRKVLDIVKTTIDNISGVRIDYDTGDTDLSSIFLPDGVGFNTGSQAILNQIPSITLNGSSTTSPSFYAPTSAGTSGYYLKSNGSGAPTWATVPSGTDEKLAVSEVSSNGTYYPIFGTGTTAATRQYDTTGFSYYEYNGTTSVTGSSRIILGNNTPAQTAGNKIGSIQIYGGTAYSHTIAASTLGPLANRTLTLPDKDGTIALTSDIPTIPSNNVTGSGSTDYLATWSGTNTLSVTSLSIGKSYNSSSDLYGTIRLFVGSTGQVDWKGQLVFYDGSGSLSKTITITPPSLTAGRTITLPDKTGTIALTSDIPTVPTITLNGSSTTSPSFYAPTGAGTSGQYLKSNGSGAPSWTSFPTIPSITLNGSSTTSPSFYAPTTAGTSGQYLKSNGSGAPTWATITVPTKTSDLTNDSGFITSSALPTSLSDLTNDMNVSDFPNDAGYSTQTIYTSTTAPTSSDGSDGDVWFVYTPSV